MDKPWNYVALGGLGGLIAWGNMSPQQRKSALDFLGDIVVGLLQPPPAINPAPPQTTFPPEPIEYSPPDEPPIFSID